MSAAARASARRGSGPHRQLSLISREAAPGDIEAIAALLFEAGGDALQFILDELAPGMNARALYRYMVGLKAGQYSYRRCLVAQRGCEIVGVVNAFPAELLRGNRIISRARARRTSWGATTGSISAPTSSTTSRFWSRTDGVALLRTSSN